MPEPLQATKMLTVAALSDQGRRRSRNEDYVGYQIPKGPLEWDTHGALFVVCDGVGDEPTGPTVSEYAVRHILDSYYRASTEDPPQTRLERAIRQANTELYLRNSEQRSQQQAESQRTATVTAALVLGGYALVVHVGDSRAYRVHKGNIEQLTEDNSLVAEMIRAGDLTPEQVRSHPWRDSATASLGKAENVTLQARTVDLAPGDRLVLCSDGLWGPVADVEIASTVGRSAPQPAVRRLVALANARGGRDNVSAIVIERVAERVPMKEEAAARPAVAAARQPAPTVPARLPSSAPRPGTAATKSPESTRAEHAQPPAVPPSMPRPSAGVPTPSRQPSPGPQAGAAPTREPAAKGGGARPVTVPGRSPTAVPPQATTPQGQGTSPVTPPPATPPAAVARPAVAVPNGGATGSASRPPMRRPVVPPRPASPPTAAGAQPTQGARPPTAGPQAAAAAGSESAQATQPAPAEPTPGSRAVALPVRRELLPEPIIVSRRQALGAAARVPPQTAEALPLPPGRTERVKPPAAGGLFYLIKGLLQVLLTVVLIVGPFYVLYQLRGKLLGPMAEKLIPAKVSPITSSPTLTITAGLMPSASADATASALNPLLAQEGITGTATSTARVVRAVVTVTPTLTLTPMPTLTITPAATLQPSPTITISQHITVGNVAQVQPGPTLPLQPDYMEWVRFSPDGAMLAVGSSGGRVLLWQKAGDSWELQKTMTGHTDGIAEVAFSGDGRMLASASKDGTVRLWRVSDGKEARRFDLPVSAWSVAFSPDGTLLAVGCGDTHVRLWQLSDGSLWKTLEGHTRQVRSVAFSPDGTMLASGSNDRTVRLWRVSDGSLLREMQGHRSVVSSVAFSPDGTVLASGGEDNTVRLWSVATGDALSAGEHMSWVRNVAFSPDGTLLASGSVDKSIRLWQVSDGTLLDQLQGHEGEVLSVTFSPDGACLVSSSVDRAVRFWCLP